MAPTFIGNPYSNEISEDSDGIDDDDWDDLLGQFPVPVVPGDSTEEDNMLYGDDEDDDDEDEDSIYHMIHEGDLGFDPNEDDDEDYDPNDDDDDDLLSDDDDDEDVDFEPGPPVGYQLRDIAYLSVTDDEDSVTTWDMSTENLAASNNDNSQCAADDQQPSLESNSDVQKPSTELPTSSESVVSETIDKGGPDST